MQITVGTVVDSRNYILHKVKEHKTYSKFTVVDIGGVAGGGWTSDIADMIIDKNTIDTENSIQMDICIYPEWDKVLSYVETNGKFDYAICTHTLEDVYNPFTTLDILPKIAKAGIITMPSLRTELSKVESNNWLGYLHHRWIFDIIDDKMLIIPKLELLSSMVKNSIKFIPVQEEIRYEWDKTIPYEIFMNNYLGPTASVVINSYNALINKYNNKQL